MRDIKFFAKHLMHHRAPMHPVGKHVAPGRQAQVPGFCLHDDSKHQKGAATRRSGWWRHGAGRRVEDASETASVQPGTTILKGFLKSSTAGRTGFYHFYQRKLTVLPPVEPGTTIFTKEN